MVLYCSQDREFAAGLLEQFSQQTNLPVVPKFDTEANKSVGLYREIVAEKGRPRCDLFWNNEICRVLILERADAGPWSRVVFSRDNLAQSITILM